MAERVVAQWRSRADLDSATLTVTLGGTTAPTPRSMLDDRAGPGGGDVRLTFYLRNREPASG